MRKKGSLVRLFAEIDKENNEIHYHKESWEGPMVTPRRFYPSRLVIMIYSKDEKTGSFEYKLDPLVLVHKAPKDERINAYVIGDEIHSGISSSYSITAASPGKNYICGSQQSGVNSSRSANRNYVCVTYCSLSQRDLEKGEPSQEKLE